MLRNVVRSSTMYCKCAWNVVEAVNLCSCVLAQINVGCWLFLNKTMHSHLYWLPRRHCVNSHDVWQNYWNCVIYILFIFTENNNLFSRSGIPFKIRQRNISKCIMRDIEPWSLSFGSNQIGFTVFGNQAYQWSVCWPLTAIGPFHERPRNMNKNSYHSNSRAERTEIHTRQGNRLASM